MTAFPQGTDQQPDAADTTPASARLRDTIERLRDKLASLQQRVAALERHVGLYSSSSGEPSAATQTGTPRHTDASGHAETERPRRLRSCPAAAWRRVGALLGGVLVLLLYSLIPTIILLLLLAIVSIPPIMLFPLEVDLNELSKYAKDIYRKLRESADDSWVFWAGLAITFAILSIVGWIFGTHGNSSIDPTQGQHKKTEHKGPQSDNKNALFPISYDMIALALAISTTVTVMQSEYLRGISSGLATSSELLANFDKLKIDLDWETRITVLQETINEISGSSFGGAIITILPFVVGYLTKTLKSWHSKRQKELREVKMQPVQALQKWCNKAPGTSTEDPLWKSWLKSIKLSFLCGLFWCMVLAVFFSIWLFHASLSQELKAGPIVAITLNDVAITLEDNDPPIAPEDNDPPIAPERDDPPIAPEDNDPPPPPIPLVPAVPIFGLPVLFGTPHVEWPPDVIFSTDSWGIRLETDSGKHLKEFLEQWAPKPYLDLNPDLKFLVVGYASHTPISVEEHDRFELNVPVANLRAKAVWKFLDKALTEPRNQELRKRITHCVEWDNYRTLHACRPYNSPVSALMTRDDYFALLERMNQSVMIYVMNGQETNYHCIGGENLTLCSELPNRYPPEP